MIMMKIQLNSVVWAAAAASVLALAGCKGGDKAAAASAASSATVAGKPALTVQLVQAQQGTISQSIEASGNLAAWQDVVVGSQSNGLRLVELRANVGDWVKKGQVLAVFSADSVNADALQAQASLLEAQAQAADAQSNAARAHSIADTGALSTQQINQYNTAAKAAQARVQAAQAALSNAKLRQGYTRVVAPDDGVISARSATVGSVVPAGTELFRMVRQGRLEWRAEVPGADIERVRTGASATITLPSGNQLQGRVRTVAPTVDAQKRVALAYVDVTNAWQQGAKAGMYASGQIVLGQGNGWLVPQTAVLARDGFQYIFVMTPDSHVQQRKVDTGARQGDLVHIVQGVDGSEQLVASGVGFLNDGDWVKVVADAAAPAASAPASAAQQP